MKKVLYKNLNARQQENYNFTKVASTLADYGYNCLRLSELADFIALHFDGSHMMIQLKRRWTIEKKYLGKSIYICVIDFINEHNIYIYNHDEMVRECENQNRYTNTGAWIKNGGYSIKSRYGSPPKGFDNLITTLG
jgi:hypothetical protein